jgi:hypothetical protein
VVTHLQPGNGESYLGRPTCPFTVAARRAARDNRSDSCQS